MGVNLGVCCLSLISGGNLFYASLEMSVKLKHHLDVATFVEFSDSLEIFVHQRRKFDKNHPA